MNTTNQKNWFSNVLIQIIIILISSFLLTFLVSKLLPSSLPLFLQEGKRPGISKNVIDETIYVDARSAAEKISKGNGILVDVRDTEDFMDIHPEGAINIPYHNESENIYAEISHILPEGKIVYILCEGKLCEMSVRVGAHLEESGYKSIIIKQDFEGWKRLKMPVTKENN